MSPWTSAPPLDHATALDLVAASTTVDAKIAADNVVESGSYAPRRLLRPVAPNTHILLRGGSPDNLSDGVSTGITTQLFHTTAVAMAGMRLVFANIYNNGGVDTPGPNDITVKANIRMAGGLNFPAYFGGKRSAVIEPGGVLVSDPIGINLAKGATFYTRAYVSCTAGGKYPLGLKTDSALEGVGAGDLADGSVNVSATRGSGPWLILGTPTTAQASPIILIQGDSIAAGYTDVVGTGDAYGWVRRALDGKLSYINLGVGSAQGAGADTIGELVNRMRLADVVTADAAIVLFGTNDLSGGGTTAAAMNSRLSQLYAILKARGLKVYGATIPPYTTSTDAWATTANQTLNAGNAQRLLVNGWIRTTPVSTDGYFEFADAVEVRGSGKWNANLTTDGIHPNAAGSTLMAAALDPTVLGVLLP